MVEVDPKTFYAVVGFAETKSWHSYGFVERTCNGKTYGIRDKEGRFWVQDSALRLFQHHLDELSASNKSNA